MPNKKTEKMSGQNLTNIPIEQVEGVNPENQYIVDAFLAVQPEAVVLYDEWREIYEDKKITIPEMLEFGLEIPQATKVVQKVISAARALKFLPKEQKQAVWLAVSDGGSVADGKNVVDAAITMAENVSKRIHATVQDVKAFVKVVKAAKAKKEDLPFA